MAGIPDADKPSSPYQATTIGNLITFSQLYRLDEAARSVGMSHEQAALDLFGCPVGSLSREAAEQLLQHFARLKAKPSASAKPISPARWIDADHLERRNDHEQAEETKPR